MELSNRSFSEYKVKAMCGEVSKISQYIHKNLEANIQAEKYRLQTSLE